MPFPTNPYWTPHTINRNALAWDAGAIAAGLWVPGGPRSQAVAGNWEIEEGAWLYTSVPSRLANPWRGPKTYNIGYDLSNVTLNANELNFYIISSINTGTPLNTPASANAYFRFEIRPNGRHDIFYKTAGGAAVSLSSTGGALAGAVRTAVTISPDKYTQGEKQFSQHLRIKVMNAAGAVLFTDTVDFPTDVPGYGAGDFEDEWQTWKDPTFSFTNQKAQDAHLFMSVGDSGGTQYWKLNHLSIVNELDSGVHDYVFAPIPDGPTLENPNFDPVEQPYMDWGYLDPAGEPFNCTINNTGDNADALERCVNWARDYGMGCLLSDGYRIRINRRIEWWQWCNQRTSKPADRDYFVEEFRPPTIHGKYTTTKPQIVLGNSRYPTAGGDVLIFEINTTNYQTVPPNFRASFPDTQRIIVSRGAWADATVYAIGDMVTVAAVEHLCIYPHTSTLANDRPSDGVNRLQFWEPYNPADSGYPVAGRPNAVYNNSFNNFELNLGSGNGGAIGIDFRGAQGTECIRVSVTGAGFRAGFGDMPGSGGALTSCSVDGGVHAIWCKDSQPGSTLSGFRASNQTGIPLRFDGGGNRGLTALVGCKIEGIAAGVVGLNVVGSTSNSNGFEFGLFLVRDTSFSWNTYNAANKCVSSNHGLVMKNVYAQRADDFATVNNTGTGASIVFNQTVASGNTAGWSHLEEAVFPAQPPIQSAGNLATLRTAQGPANFNVVQTPTPLQYLWDIYEGEVVFTDLRVFLGSNNIAPPADLFEHHYIGDSKYLTIDDVTIDVVADHGANGGGFTNNLAALDAAAAAAAPGDVLGFRSGVYLLNDTWDCPAGVHIVGLKTRMFFRPAINPGAGAPFGSGDTAGRPVVRHGPGTETSIVAGIGYFQTPNTPTGFALSVECPIVHYNSFLLRRSGEGFGGLPGYPNAVDQAHPLVQFNGPDASGQMYTANVGNGFNVKAGFSFFRVKDTDPGGGLVEFYSLNGEHCGSWPGNIFLENFNRVKIYSYKSEANLPILVASNGLVLEAWGPQGNGTPFIHDSIDQTGWVPVGDSANETGHTPKPTGVFPAGVPSAGVTLSNVGQYMVGAMQDSGRYQNNEPIVFGEGTRPDGSKILNIVSALDGSGAETFATPIYARPLFVVDGNYDRPNCQPLLATAITASGVTLVATTDKASGVLYQVIVPDGDNPTVAQIKAGQQSSGAAAPGSGQISLVSWGANTFPANTGLAGSTVYDTWVVHTDAAGSNSVKRLGTFVTLAASELSASAALGITGSAALTAGLLAALGAVRWLPGALISAPGKLDAVAPLSWSAVADMGVTVRTRFDHYAQQRQRFR